VFSQNADSSIFGHQPPKNVFTSLATLDISRVYANSIPRIDDLVLGRKFEPRSTHGHCNVHGPNQARYRQQAPDDAQKQGHHPKLASYPEQPTEAGRCVLERSPIYILYWQQISRFSEDQAPLQSE